MNILITTGVFPPDLSGVASYVAIVAEKLASHGHQVTVLSAAEPQDILINESWKYSFKLCRVDRRAGKVKRFFQMVKDIRQLGEKADLLFANGLLLETRVANLFLRKPLVLRLVSDPAWEKIRLAHSPVEEILDFNNASSTFKQRALKMLRNFCLKGASKIIVSSKHLASIAVVWGIQQKKIEIIPSVSRNKKKFIKLNLPLQTAVVFSTAGRLLPHKGFEKFIEALVTVPEVGLAIIGDGPSRAELCSLAKTLGVEKRVYFTGKKEMGEAEDYIKASDAFIAPTTLQGFSMSTLEALNAGVLVAFPREINTEGLIEDGKNGILFELEQTDRLFVKLKDILSSSEVKKEILQGQKELLQNFDVSCTVAKVEKVFKDAIGVN